MKNIRKIKKTNIKLIIGFCLLLFLFTFIFVGFLKKKDRDINLDHKLAVIGKDGVIMVSISNERKMINLLTLEGEVLLEFNDMWKKENKKLGKNIFWYSFGFYPDKILILDSLNQWKDDKTLINNLGFLKWLKYKKNYGRMLLKEEKIKNKLNENDLILDEIMVRDFSESRLNNEELRLSVFNNTNEAGLANFIAKRLDWSGFSVVSVENNNEKIDNCLIVYGNKTDLNYGWKIINKIFDCDKKNDENLNENELEIYFGDNFASMINYSSYYKYN